MEEKGCKDLLVHLGSVYKVNPEEMESKEKLEKQVQLEGMAYKDRLVHLESVCKDNPEEMVIKDNLVLKETLEQQVPKVMREMPENLDYPEETESKEQ